MPNQNPWSTVATADPGKVILGVDFPAEGRREADFGDLMKKMGAEWSGYSLMQTIPPNIRLDERPSSDTYVRHWIQDGPWREYEVVAVMGYCVGGVYAAPIARSVADAQGSMPEVVLFDPQFTDAGLLASEMVKNISMAGPVFSDEEAEQGRKDTERIVAANAGDLMDAATAIVGLYRDLASIAFKRLGLNDDRRDEIIRLFESYMAWLASAAEIDPAPVWAGATAVMSADYLGLEAQGNASVGAATRIIDRRFSLDVTHADLMRADSTAELLLDKSRL
ncbi:hypothetical protein [Actinomadura violacea]|uniref:Uncharacterized protein n=1 Tax=Actinomadura violacea TaxID=2819934 RepID=A0ABS3RJN5_9ACTN|nr:hypothetical protein [Actinomadura violacea]MBO2456937.1 hypothetical protein [Actinomadura violacea]